MTVGTRSAPRGRGSARRRRGSAARDLLLVVVGALVVSALLRMFVGQMFVIPSDSMQNTLLKGDRVLVQKITGFHRGDVVVFADPGGWLLDEPTQERGAVGTVLEHIGVLPDSSTGHLIKRVVGMPGDHVVCCDRKGRITVNGEPLDETSYLYTAPGGRQVAPSDIDFSVVVPAGRLFVLGDHRDDSADSRCHLSDLSATQKTGEVAFVPENLVVGQTFAVVSPLHRARLLRRAATYARVPAPSQPAPAEGVIRPAGVTC